MDARALATRIVSVAILVVAIALLVGAFFAVRAGGAVGLVGGVIFGALGIVALLASFFFLLVPTRIENLQELNEEWKLEHPEERH